MNSKSLISFVWFSTVLVACSLKENQNTVEVRKKMDTVDGDIAGVFLIPLSDSVSVHWDNRAQNMVNDTPLSRATAYYTGKKQSIIDRISDTTETPARICGTERTLAIGDVAFLLIDKSKTCHTRTPSKFNFVFLTRTADTRMDCLNISMVTGKK